VRKDCRSIDFLDVRRLPCFSYSNFRAYSQNVEVSRDCGERAPHIFVHNRAKYVEYRMDCDMQTPSAFMPNTSQYEEYYKDCVMPTKPA
jgi:hypothetical protein